MREPIAVIGLGLRFPGGASSPESFWDLLISGRDAVTELQPERWDIERFYHPRPGTPGKAYTKSAGQLDDIFSFDANFFGISPREAGQVDPQQRMLLEMAWEALEDAGIAPSKLRGSNTAVFVGISSNDSAGDHFDDPASGNAYFMTGSTLSIAANRVSYVFDLHGPSMAIDTACSSSLVALHQACHCLWSGTAGLAVCGGVNILLSPYPFIGFSQASMLSPEGRCKAFDATGRGYVRSEGGAVIVLKPLAQAQRDGDPVRAIIVGVNSNCDGRTAGISLPNPETQKELLRQVYKEAMIDPDAIAYVEMHGTGTMVGDPTEAHAVGEVIGHCRSEGHPLLIGSVKTNIGHLESGSGMAGLAKAILCIQKRMAPASLHFSKPNPSIPFRELNLRVVTEPTPLASEDGAILVGVNSFGFGGANAHVLLSSGPPLCPSPAPRPSPSGLGGAVLPLLLSARSEESLVRLAFQYHRLIEGEEAPYIEIARAAALRREHHPVRLAACGKSPEDIAEALQNFGSGAPCPGIVRGRAHPGVGRIVVVFSGNGSQWLGMGRLLYAGDEYFRHRLEEADTCLKGFTGWSVVDEIHATPEQSRLGTTEVAQPVLFAIQVALWESLQARGACCSAVLGHSVGEVAAAYAAGILDLASAARVIYERSRFQEQTRGQGRMAAAGLSASAAAEAIACYPGVELAGINSPNSTTLSGPVLELESLGSVLAGRGVFFRLLDLDYAFHSRAMDSFEHGLKAALQDLSPAPRRLRFMSTVTGGDLEGPELDARYWWNNVRQPVRFHDAVHQLAEGGYELFLELGPHAILLSYLNETLRALNGKAGVLGALDKKEPEDTRWGRVLGQLYVQGGDIDFDRLCGGSSSYRVELPTYPWHRERHRCEPTVESWGLLHGKKSHPLLGWRRAGSAVEWEGLLDTSLLPWLADHRVGDTVLFPAAGFVEMALAASSEVFGSEGPIEVMQMEIVRALELSATQTRVVRLTMKGEVGAFEIASRGYMEPGDWGVHAVGRAIRGTRSQTSTAPPSFARTRVGQHLKGEDLYTIARRLRLNYGPSFQCVEAVWSQDDWAWAELRPPTADSESYGRFLVHPSLLDAAFQTLFVALTQAGEGAHAKLFLPTTIGHACLLQSGATPSFCVARLKRVSVRSVVAEFCLYAADWTLIAQFTDCRFRRVDLRSERQFPGLYEIKPVLCDAPANPSGVDGTAHPSLRHMLGPMPRPVDGPVNRRYHEAVLPSIEALVAAFAYSCLADVLDTQTDADIPEIFQRGGFLPGREPLVRYLLTRSERAGHLVRSTNGWRAAAHNQPSDPNTLWSQLIADHPELLPELVQVGRCGRHLRSALRGEFDPDVLIEPTNSAVFPHLQDNSVSWEAVQHGLAVAIETFARDWAQPRRLRVLYLGLAQAASIRRLLRLLPADAFDLVYADRDEATLAQVEAERDGSPAISTWALGAEGLPDPGEQDAPFDLIIIWNPADWAEDSSDLLSWAGYLASPTGLVLLGAQVAVPVNSMVQGLRPRWWGSLPLPPQRAENGGLMADDWRSLLDDAGYSSIELLGPDRLPLRNACLLAAWRPDLAEAMQMPLEQEQTTRRVVVCSEISNLAFGLSQRLAEQLRKQGCRAWLVRPADDAPPADAWTLVGDSSNKAQLLRIFADLARDEETPELVVWLANGGVMTHTPADPYTATDSCAVALLSIVQALTEAFPDGPPQLVLVTSNGLPAIGREPQETIPRPDQWALAGLRRVIANEHSALRCRIIDLQEHGSCNDSVAALARELARSDGEDEVVLSNGRRYGMRLRRFPVGSLSRLARRKSDGDPPGFRLDFVNPGSLDNLGWQASESPEVGPGEIAVEVRAAGLNFRDVMWAMGLLQDEAVEDGFAGPTLGMECSGVVLAVGDEVRDFAVGDSVVCFAPSCFSNRVTVSTTAAALMPKDLGFAEAATIPSAFFTVYYALEHLAHLKRGDKILIHGAAGGVGLAAIQYARHVGAEVFATAGSPEKRDFLHLLGVEHAFDSRSLDFGNDILMATDGHGVDVVLNSLAGEAIERSLQVLRPFGRFLELGKRDFYADSKIGLRPFRNNISYFGIDADQVMKDRPELARQLFREMMALFDSGFLRPLPYRRFAFSRVHEAFRTMQQARHIGKLVLVPETSQLTLDLVSRTPAVAVIDSAEAYLITGGMGGFGLATARWLVRRGARHIFLLGRSGAVSPEAKKTITELEGGGARLRVLRADVADPDQLEAALQTIRATGLPLRGVVHAAMVLDDGMIKNLSAERLRRVLAPKAQGAWNLHRLTLRDRLTFFILYSSATSFLGSAGQANYVAANAFLEGLAEYRRSQDLPALAISWGAIADVGVLARDQKLSQALAARTGFRAMQSTLALELMDRLIGADRTQCAAMDLDWSVIQRSLPGAKAARFREVLSNTDTVASGDGTSFRERIAGLAPEEAKPLIEAALREHVAKVLRIPADRIDPDLPLQEMGMDSLMAVELALEIEKFFGIPFSSMSATAAGSVSATAARIAGMLLSTSEGERH